MDLLERSPYAQAAALIRTDSRYTDLSPTQYETALDWLAKISVLELGTSGYQLASSVTELDYEERRLLMFTNAVEDAAPPWLADADILVRNTDEIPDDALSLASVLELTQDRVLAGVRQIHGRIDLTRRQAVGAFGEGQLVALLERQWPGSTTHIAAHHDGFGYDVAFVDHVCETWHLEVKTTTRRGRLVVYLSRQEYEVGRFDSSWRLLVLGLDEENQLQCLATARHQALLTRAPRDSPGGAQWQSARYELHASDLEPGLRFVWPCADSDAVAPLLSTGIQPGGLDFAWMPMIASS